MIEELCQLSPPLLMGVSAAIGALTWAAYRIYSKNKGKTRKEKIQWSRIIDTLWQSTAAGVVAGSALMCSWEAIITAMIFGAGIDNVANKIQFGKTKILNLVHLFGSVTSNKK